MVRHSCASVIRFGVVVTALFLGAGPVLGQRGGHGGGGHGGGGHGGGGMHSGSFHAAPAGGFSRAPASVGAVRGPSSFGGAPTRSFGSMPATTAGVNRAPASWNSVNRGTVNAYPRAANSVSHYPYAYGRYPYSNRGYYGYRYRYPFYAGYYGGYYPFFGLGFFPGYYGGYGSLASLAALSPGYYGDYGAYDAAYFNPSLAASPGPALPADQAAAPPPAELPAEMPSGQELVLRVHVLPSATVWVNGGLTTTTGEFREFISTGLQPGRTYTYTVRAKWSDGQLSFDQTRRVKVQGGEVRSVDFAGPPSE